MPSPAVYRSPQGLASATTALFALHGAAALGSAAVLLAQYAAGGSSSAEADWLATVVGSVEYLLFLGSAAVFLPWMYRVRVNAEVIYPHGQQRARVLAVVGWFIPFAGIWFPWRVANDVWRASAPAGEHGVPQPVPARAGHVWWVSLMLSWLLFFLGTESLGSEASLHYADSRREALGILVAGELLTLAAMVSGLLMVRRLTAMQEAHAARARAAWAPPVTA
ncbi:DUF4328 domain-containing protein [Kitasatospora phosalacinea]|uniref:DUF4328 domain-containing protein n=1 Tax=Kitasatospora phosalacinea TaxID=2065 RepID=A0A9W6UMN3_9ACTN|nr:DUF4328 domain-containing protein [Kitasatospora phosalacinea]GLW53307.1 hypothetical protein Kpho01_13180 [Kitasatospora phosalacinea]